jgi:hypothetical protein
MGFGTGFGPRMLCQMLKNLHQEKALIGWLFILNISSMKID